MNTPELSIIVPVYQAKSFLKNCVESILNQEFQDYELLLIDDGSTDGSETMCDEYAKEDNRILVFHQPNKGVSAARNLGLDHARGEYICFVDADDSIEKGLLSQCMQALKESNADLLHHGMTKNIWKGDSIINSIPKYSVHFQGLCNPPELKDLIIHNYAELSRNVFDYIFKKNLVGEIKFNEKIPYSEDTIFVNEILAVTKNCYFLNVYGYQYNARTGSAAYRWQPEMLTCYEKTFDAIRNLLQKFDISDVEERSVMGPEIINAYSSFLYNLCLPSCELNFSQKKKLAQQARKKFQVRRYLKSYSTANSSLFDKAKLLFVRFHLDGLLIFLGTIYERIVTNGERKN